MKIPKPSKTKKKSPSRSKGSTTRSKWKLKANKENARQSLENDLILEKLRNEDWEATKMEKHLDLEIFRNLPDSPSDCFIGSDYLENRRFELGF